MVCERASSSFPFWRFGRRGITLPCKIWLNPLLNIAMFLPLGVLLPLAVKRFRRWFWMLTAGVGTSLVIELLQYVLGRGQADVDDLICNVLGAMLGYCFCMLFVSLVRKQWKTAGVYVIFPFCPSLLWPVCSSPIISGPMATLRTARSTTRRPRKSNGCRNVLVQ